MDYQSFVERYYQLFDSSDGGTRASGLAELYDPRESRVTFEGDELQGREAILAKFSALSFGRIQRQITKIDSQPLTNDSALLLVLGQLKTDDDIAHSFVHTFVLKLVPSGDEYFISREVFSLVLHNEAMRTLRWLPYPTDDAYPKVVNVPTRQDVVTGHRCNAGVLSPYFPANMHKSLKGDFIVESKRIAPKMSNIYEWNKYSGGPSGPYDSLGSSPSLATGDHRKEANRGGTKRKHDGGRKVQQLITRYAVPIKERHQFLKKAKRIEEGANTGTVLTEKNHPQPRGDQFDFSYCL